MPVTSANGTFTAQVPNSGGVWRARWSGLTLAAGAGRAAVRRALVLLLAAAMVGVAAPARADLEIGMEDEGLILSSPEQAPAAVADWSALGVDVVRIHARWWEIAPAAAAQRKPAGFDAGDPDDSRLRLAQPRHRGGADPLARA